MKLLCFAISSDKHYRKHYFLAFYARAQVYTGIFLPALQKELFLEINSQGGKSISFT